MNKTTPDELTCSLSALTIKSTLEILSTSTISSETCGLGWTFDLREPDAERKKRRGSRSRDQPEGPYDLYMTVDSAFLGHTAYQLASVECKFRVSSDGTSMRFHKDNVHLASSLYIGEIGEYNTYRGARLTCTVILSHAAAPSKPVAERISTITLGSLDGQNFMDTKVYAYTRRSNGGAINPCSFFIHSTIIDQYGCEPLSLLFGQAEGFRSEDALLDLHRLPASQESLPTLDYQDDSDFEDDDEVDAQGYPFDVSDSPQERLSSTPVDNSKVSKDSEKENSYTDSSTTQNTVLPHIVVPRPEDVEAVMRSQKVLRYGRIKVLSNGAYRTWRAIIHYIYTGTLQFAPLRSTKRSRPSPQACSPKSVYRVADEYGIDTLKQLAFKEIVGNITTKNVFEEVFSYFAHMYPAVHDHGMKVLLKNKSVPAVKKGIMENFHKYGEGAMKPHEKETMNKIMAQLI